MPPPTHLSVLHHELHTGAYLHTALTSHLTVVEEDLGGEGREGKGDSIILIQSWTALHLVEPPNVDTFETYMYGNPAFYWQVNLYMYVLASIELGLGSVSY